MTKSVHLKAASVRLRSWETAWFRAAATRGLPAALLTVAGWAATAPAAAAPARCVVPRVEACRGCLQHVSVRPRPDGSCRVSFDYRPGSTATVMVAPRYRFSRARLPARPSDRCFRFNGEIVCE